MSIEEIKFGIYKSSSPNKLLAKIFKELGIIEEYGSGVKKIMKLFRDSGLQEPIIDTSQNHIISICYKENKLGDGLGVELGDKLGDKLGDNQKKILELINTDKYISISNNIG